MRWLDDNVKVAACGFAMVVNLAIYKVCQPSFSFDNGVLVVEVSFFPLWW